VVGVPDRGDGGAVAGAWLSLIGPFTATRDGRAVAGPDLGGRKARLLLKLLAVERGRTVPADRITEVLWGGAPPAGPAENVATFVSRLRRALGDEVIQGGRPGYRLGPAPAVRVDLDEASRWAGEAARRLAAAEPALAVVAATRAHDLLTAGLVLEDEPAADWAQPARAEQAGLLQEIRGMLAEAALGAGDPAGAAAAAAAAVAQDPYDERARRALMRAHAVAGEPARALASYAELRDLLATELGADPAPETQALHLAVLREGDLPAPATGAPPGLARWPVLPGRVAELARLRDLWNAAAESQPGLVLICGEAGIGKTRLADELAQAAAGTGGSVLSARCYETERSLFLQPLVDAVAAAARTIPAARMQDLAGPHGPALARLIPEVAALLGPFPAPAEPRSAPRSEIADLERRRAFEAVTAFVTALAEHSPVLLSLDDLQNAGQATVELLHYLIRHARRSRLLVIATVRAEEGAAAISSLAGVSGRIDLGVLPAAAVAALAAEAGLAGQADSIMGRTRGHTLFVVETLRALTAGTTGIPDSLEAAVLARVQRTGPGVESALRAAAVLGSSFSPGTLAALLGASPHAAVGFCTAAEAARLLVVAERDYEFANDLIQQVLYATTPEPARVAYHGHAADLLTGRPEPMARHAAAAGDWLRAARGWLLAGEQALARAAAADAEQLLTQSIGAAARAGDPEVQARALLARGYAREIQADYAGAVRDIEAAIASARQTGDRRMEMTGLIALGGDAPVALGRPVPDAVATVHRGLSLATALSDRAAEARLRARLAIFAVSGLRFTEAAQQGQLAVRAARASGDEEALALALDGYKAAIAYVGDISKLTPVLDELEPLLRRRGDLRLLSWTQFESAFPAIAAGDWAAASARIEESLATGRRVGSMAHAAWHMAISGALARLQGHQVEALRRGRAAVATGETEPHAWTIAVAVAELATTLLEAGERAEATTLLERALTAGPEQETEAGRLRCLAPLAEATGSAALLTEATALLASISAPPGQAWITADGCYLAIARSWLGRSEPERARSALAPLLAATAQVPWVAPLAAASLVDGLAATAMGRREEATGLLKRAADLGHRHGLPRIAADATAALK
jgi:DNA-binding SARP family transcriptional activator/tetratricopeptide (TPR) repeat protein